MSGGTVEISVKGKMDTVFAFKLGYLEIYGHRLPSFLPLTSDNIRLPEQLFSDGRQARTTG